MLYIVKSIFLQVLIKKDNINDLKKSNFINKNLFKSIFIFYENFMKVKFDYA